MAPLFDETKFRFNKKEEQITKSSKKIRKVVIANKKKHQNHWISKNGQKENILQPQPLEASFWELSLIRKTAT